MANDRVDYNDMSPNKLTFAKKHAVSSAAKVCDDDRRILRSFDEHTDEHGLTAMPLTVIQELSGLNHISFMCGFTRLVDREIVNVLKAGVLMINYGLVNRRNSSSIAIGSIDCQCNQCEPDQTYECDGCGLTTPYCFGADDKFFDYCDSCVFAMSEMGVN
jgi:hypothetical protein